MLKDLARLPNRRTARFSSWDRTGRNADYWIIEPGETRTLADIEGPGCITHIWMTQAKHYRECLLRFTWDDAAFPSVLVPLGDFFCLGHGMVNSFQSLLFTASANQNHTFNSGCALNCYAPMPFRRRALIELVNESREPHQQYFYVDCERRPDGIEDDLGCFHAEFRRANPFRGWGPQVMINSTVADIANKERLAWDSNYVILQTRGRGKYIGCNLSVTNLMGGWWGEGDDMIWVDGYKWPPDLHGTGSEDYLNQAWGMQPNAFLRNGSSIFEGATRRFGGKPLGRTTQEIGGYQTSYVFHLENPVHFRKEIKVTIEHGHGNHLQNEMSSVAYWYAETPAPAAKVPPVEKRLPVPTDADGRWVRDRKAMLPSRPVKLNAEMRKALAAAERNPINRKLPVSKWISPFVMPWRLSRLLPKKKPVTSAPPVKLSQDLGWRTLNAGPDGFVNAHDLLDLSDGIVYLATEVDVASKGSWKLLLGHDGGCKLFVDGIAVLQEARRQNPAWPDRSQATVKLAAGRHTILCALDTDRGLGWGIFLRFQARPAARKGKPVFPAPVNMA